MLKSLSLKNFLTVDSLTLPLSQGFTAFTGETGAGKTILIEAISLAFGKKCMVNLVRLPAQEAHISLWIQLPFDHPLLSFLKIQGFHDPEAEEGSVLIKRILTAEGRSRCFINDSPATLGALKECGQSLIEIHGQFDRLLKKQEHRLFLDSYGALTDQVTSVQESFHKWQKASSLYNKANHELKEFQKERVYFFHHLEELHAFKPQKNEEDLLLEKRTSFLNQKKLETLLAECDSLFDGTHSPQNAFHLLEKNFSKLSAIHSLFDQVRQDLIGASSAWMDLSSSYQSARASVGESDSETLDTVEDRLHLLRTLARKHQSSPNELFLVLKTLEEKKEHLEALEEQKKKLQEEVNDSKSAYQTQAHLLSKARAQISQRLEKQVLTHLQKLKLERLIFKVQSTLLPEEQWMESGLETIEFLASANGESDPGSFEGNLSGGELSRVLLALKTELAQTTSLSTIIFDEIDSAMSGAVATHIGSTLHQLAENRQVLVITHTPQVASYADQHVRVDKEFHDNRALTSVTLLNPQERVQEMARMLSGTHITQQALDQAHHFLESNQGNAFKNKTIYNEEKAS